MTERADDPVPAQRRSTAVLLRDRVFGPWFVGLITSNSGNWLFNVTAAVAIYRLSGSALLVGLVSVAQFAPMLVITPLAGAWSDRWDRRQILLWATALSAVFATALAVAGQTIGLQGTRGAVLILLAALGIGLGLAVASPTLNALVPSLVEDDDLEDAIALTSLTFSVGRALGPGTAGVLLATVDFELAFIVNALTFVVFAVVLARLRPRRTTRTSGAGDRSLRAGWNYVRDDRVVLLLILGVAATGFAADPMITFAPALAEAVRGGETLAAVLVSAYGVAAIPAAAVSGPLQRRIGSLTVAITGTATMALGLSVSAIAPGPVVAVLGFGLTGFGFVFALTGFTTALQRRVPDLVRGRVMALWSVAFLGNRPIAAMIDGAAADLVGVRWAMLIAISVAGAGALLGVRLRKRLRPG